MSEVSFKQGSRGRGVFRCRGPDAASRLPRSGLNFPFILKEAAIRSQDADAPNPGPTEATAPG
eukprot:10342168-Lingulodinium_polyedra.AAC.1